MLDIAVPCGLLLNELLSNAFKHAFPGSRSGCIIISLKRKASEKVVLAVADDGVGFSPSLELEKLNSLGITTIFAIAENQLSGKVKYSSVGGVKCSIEFDGNLYQERV